MKIKLVLATVLLGVFAFGVVADDKKPPAMPDPAMMQAMEKAGTPGAEHKKLDAFAGTWTTKATFWMVPGADPMTMTGSSESKWTMGGRYLEETFKGDFMGMPFEGHGVTGYDNVKKQYWGSWIDNMSTGMMTSTGSGDGTTFTFTGTMADPMTAKDSTINQKVTVTDADHHTMEMWAPGPDGKMYKSMEIVYSRKK
jgi:hypothetical protein